MPFTLGSDSSFVVIDFGTERHENITFLTGMIIQR